MNQADKIKGALFGAALGDALGLGTEFMTRQEVKYYYPEGMRHFSQIIRDAHRCMWERGDWTNDTQLLILLMESIVDNDKLDLCDFATRMKHWFDENPSDMVDFYHWLFNDPEWLERPLESAHRMWIDRKLVDASNEGLPRAIITGILGEPHLIGNTMDVIAMTHDDTRCTTCGVVIATMADKLFRENRCATYEELKEICETLDPRVLISLEIAHNGSFQDLAINDLDTQWYTRKTMAAALWTIWHCSSAEEILHTIVDAGGDADTNGALAMGLAGLKYGFDALPSEVYKLNRFKELEEATNRFTQYILNRDEE